MNKVTFEQVKDGFLEQDGTFVCYNDLDDDWGYAITAYVTPNREITFEDCEIKNNFVVRHYNKFEFYGYYVGIAYVDEDGYLDGDKIYDDNNEYFVNAIKAVVAELNTDIEKENQ